MYYFKKSHLLLVWRAIKKPCSHCHCHHQLSVTEHSWHCARHKQGILNASCASVNLHRFIPMTCIPKHFFEKNAMYHLSVPIPTKKMSFFFKLFIILKRVRNTITFHSSSFMLLSLSKWFWQDKINSWERLGRENS